jgi:hypothetical protein
MATCKRVGMMALWALILAPAASAQVRVSVQWLYPIESLYLADLSPYTVGAQPEFLSINLLNGATQQTVRLEVTLSRERPTASQIFRGTTDPFVVTGTGRRITNRDLACDDCPYALDDAEITTEWEDLLAETGRFPAGSYVIRVRVLNGAGTLELDRSEVRIELVNPSRIELVSPGTRFGETPELVTNTTPRFLWSSDAGVVSGGGEYQIRVVPVDEAASAEDAIQQFASWEATTRATTAIYPGSVSAIPLQPGGTYVWQVVREVRGSSGTELISSPIYWFRMAEAQTGDDPAGQGTGGAVGVGNQLQQLARTLGLDLSGFRPTGQISVDGQLYPADRLEELLRAILAGEISIQSITVR